jgi:regulatory protein
VKITDIKQQVKRHDRYSIYIDGKYACSFGELELMNGGLRIGIELSQKEFEALKARAEYDKAYDRAISYVAMRERSEWEMRSYLKRKEYDQEIIDSIITKLQDRRLLNDESFARAWVASRRLLKAISKRKLRQELQLKHINRELIDEVLGDDETDERQVLRELINKKRQLTRFADDTKLMQYLSRQGYSYEDIKASMKPEDE